MIKFLIFSRDKGLDKEIGCEVDPGSVYISRGSGVFSLEDISIINPETGLL